MEEMKRTVKKRDRQIDTERRKRKRERYILSKRMAIVSGAASSFDC